MSIANPDIAVINELPNYTLVQKGFERKMFNNLNEAKEFCRKQNWVYKIVKDQKNCCFSNLT